VLPFFFVALAAAFLVGRLAQGYTRWRQVFFFALVGMLCAGVGLLLHLAALSLVATQQKVLEVLIDDLPLLLALVLALGGFGGLLGGALRLGVVRSGFAAGTAQLVNREVAPAAFRAKAWAIIWRLRVAGIVGALPVSEGAPVLGFSLQLQAAPMLYFASPFIWIITLLPILLLVGGMLLGAEARQNGSTTARIGGANRSLGIA
jgi:hypothetical protein